MSTKYFLARSSRIFGPYSAPEIETMRINGDYEKFSWFWDEGRKTWQAIDPAPTSPPQLEVESRTLSGTISTPVDSEQISALCYDHHRALSGWIVNTTDFGCEFIAAGRAASPELAERSSVFLHLFHPETGRSMNISGRVGAPELRGGQWRYRIYWKKRPQIMADAATVA